MTQKLKTFKKILNAFTLTHGTSWGHTRNTSGTTFGWYYFEKCTLNNKILCLIDFC